jgi:adenine-specific DNA-methyltransferase
MASPKKPAKSRKRPIERYEHTDKKRANNPPVGLVTPETDPVTPTHKVYDYVQPVPSVRTGKELDYDPHLDPQLVWAGKKEHTSFEVPTVSLHVHETIDPRTIIEAVRKRNGLPLQPSLFERPDEKLPLRDAIDFYKHPHGWSNRLIAGDSLLVMNSLVEKEGMAGHVQMVYIDPPYGIKYGSNFQPFVNKRDVKDGKDEDLTQEPETIRAFRDTWELGIHSYLSYLRDRLLVARDLLTESGSIFVQIGDENIHLARNVLDDVFESSNFCSVITIAKTAGATSDLMPGIGDYLVWYAKDKKQVKYRQLYREKEDGEGDNEYRFLLMPDGTSRTMTREERAAPETIPVGAERFRPSATTSQRPPGSDPFTFRGHTYRPGMSQYWKTSVDGLTKLGWANRLIPRDESISYLRKLNDFPVMPINNLWMDTRWGFDAQDKRYVVETNTKVVARTLLMTTDPGDLVFDPTCGSGTTAYVAEQWGRRWITCDTSRVAITIAKQRLMTAEFNYYELAHPEEGVGSGFQYRTVPHIMLKSIANNPEIREGMSRAQIDAAIARYADQETLYDQPYSDSTRVRVTGPFTVEAVPAPTVRSLEEIDEGAEVLGEAPRKTRESLADVRRAPIPLLDASVARKGPTLRHSEWRDELLKAGLRGKGGHHIDFSRVEPLAGTRWLHADAETKGVKPERVVISFGPEYSLLEQRQVELAWEEARTLSPRPAILVFAAFEFDPEAAKDIDGMTKEKTGMTFLTAQMNADLLTEDLKKKRASNQGFWLVGRPDTDLRQITKGDHKGKYEVEVRGFDYYNTRAGTIDSGDTSKIAMWLLDTDYDGRSLYPRQVFFPMADDDEGWARLARNLKAELDSELIQKYRGIVSLPFEAGANKRVAVKVIDDRGIESLKVVEVR